MDHLQLPLQHRFVGIFTNCNSVYQQFLLRLISTRKFRAVVTVKACYDANTEQNYDYSRNLNLKGFSKVELSDSRFGICHSVK
jgi:hypothetical protein